MPKTAVNLGFQHVFARSKAESAHTLLLLHGTGGDEKDLLTLGATLDPDASLLSPRGKVLESGMPRFFRRFGRGVFDVEDLKFRTAELTDFVGAAAKEYDFDPKQVIAAGYSNGANIAASMLLLRPGVLAGAILLRPMVPLIPEVQPDLQGIQVFLAGGRRDPIVRPEETERLAKLLLDYGGDVSLHWTDQGHELSAAEIEQARLWLTVRML